MRYLSHNVKMEMRAGIVDTLQAFNMGMQNQENVDPNSGYYLPKMTPEQLQ